MFRSSSLTRVAALLVVAAPLAAQQAPRTIPAPDATYAEPFSSVNIGGVRELSNGRVVVTDPRDKVVQMLDFARGTATPIGREGSGPGEYGMPMRLFQARSDTTYLFDPLNQRYMMIGADAKPVGEFRVELDRSAPQPAGDTRTRQVPPAGAGTPPAGQQRQAPAGGPQRVSFGGGFFARYSDGQGRLYGEGPNFAITDAGPITADTAPLLRYDRVTGRIDTMTYINLPPSNTQISGSRDNQRVVIGGAANPLMPRDEWAVFPDGKIAVVRAKNYQVEYILPNKTVVKSTPIAFTPIRVTDADKREEEELRNRARQGQMMMTMSQGPGGTQRAAQMGPGANAPPLPPLENWPDVKPPFRAGMASVLARPNGELWVRRLERAGAEGTLYDVINANGAVTHQVRVPKGLTIVGFGNGTVYTTRLDEDDLAYLQRHRIT